MMNSKLKDFLDDIVQRGPQVDYWFMTKQTLSDFYFELFISQIIERYQISGKKKCFDKFYSEQFKANHLMNEKYPKQGESLNTFRNTIITEYLGLTFRTGNTYDTSNTTDAYDLISKYIFVRIQNPLENSNILTYNLNKTKSSIGTRGHIL